MEEVKFKLQITGKHLYETITEVKFELERYKKRNYEINETDYSNTIFNSILAWLEKEGKKHLVKENCLKCQEVYQSILKSLYENRELQTKDKETYWQGLFHLANFRAKK